MNPNQNDKKINMYNPYLTPQVPFPAYNFAIPPPPPQQIHPPQTDFLKNFVPLTPLPPAPINYHQYYQQSQVHGPIPSRPITFPLVQQDDNEQNMVDENTKYAFCNMSENEIKRSVIMMNLKDSINEVDIKNILEIYSRVEAVNIMRLKDNTFAVVKFVEPDIVNILLKKNPAFLNNDNIVEFNHEILRTLLNKHTEMVELALHRLSDPENFAKLLSHSTDITKTLHNIMSKLPLAFDAHTLRVREIWIGGLPQNMPQAQLTGVLSKYGKIEHVDMFYKMHTFAFVKFQLADSARRAVDDLPNLAQVCTKLSYSDFLKRHNIVGDDPYFKDNEHDLTNLVYMGFNYNTPLPSARLIEEKFSEFGKVLNIMMKPSIDESLKHYCIVEMESKEQAKKIRKYFYIEDKESKRRSKLGDKKAEINVLLKPNISGNLSDFISPYLNISSSSTSGNLTNIVDDSLIRNSEKHNKNIVVIEKDKNDEQEFFWTGFLTRLRKSQTGIDVFELTGESKDILEDFMFNIDIGLKVPVEEMANIMIHSTIVIKPSNITYLSKFREHMRYLIEKKAFGVVSHLDNYLLYIVPYSDYAKDLYADIGIDECLGLFVANNEPE